MLYHGNNRSGLVRVIIVNFSITFELEFTEFRKVFYKLWNIKETNVLSVSLRKTNFLRLCLRAKREFLNNDIRNLHILRQDDLIAYCH